MSKLDDLINELCPDGVEYKKLVSVANILYGFPSNAALFNDEKNGMPLIRIRDVLQGKTDTYTTEDISDDYLIIKNDLLVGMDGNFHVGKWNSEPGYLCQRVCKIYPNETETVLNNYLYHLLKPIFKQIEDSKLGGTVKHLSAKDINNLEIPVPPLEIQNEIVRILDNFTELEEELEEELVARRKQYEYYRDSLLTFDDSVEWKTMGEVFNICMCKRILKQDTLPNGDIPFYQNGTIGKEAKLYITRELYEQMKAKYKLPKKGEILLSTAGTVGRAIVYDGADAFFQDSNIVWLSNDESLVTNEFLFHYCKSMPWKIPSRGTIKHLHNYMIADTPIPILTKDRQTKVALILDRFEALCNDITSGLPAEIEARHKQYEYYRDKLLTFKRKDEE